MTSLDRTLYDKIWDTHRVPTDEASAHLPDTLYIDLHLLHEVTSPQAFSTLRERRLTVRNPAQCLATMDHCTPTSAALPDGSFDIVDQKAKTQLAKLVTNCKEHQIPMHPLGSDQHGIVHIIGPELGLSQPGLTIVCGDSHTSTHGAFGALAFGIGTGQVAHVLASQCLLAHRSKTFEIRIEGRLNPGVSAKDLILKVISKIGTEGGTGHVFEFTGSTIRALDMEQRMTICNMAIEGGARAGLIAPDDTTFNYLAGREHAPRGRQWDEAVATWQKLPSDPLARFDRSITLDASRLNPMVTYGTSPGTGMAVTAPVPDPALIGESRSRETAQKALSYMKVESGRPMLGMPIDVVFIGSCTNGRLSDLRDAAKVMRGRSVHASVRMMVVPGSRQVKRAAEDEGLDEVFRAAGAEWREPGCSMCLAMNGDRLEPGQLAVSTSNRNFEGRQGPGGRTILASPLTAAACAVNGAISDVREML